MEDTPLRSVMFNKAKEQVDKSTGGFYPAPYAIINVLKDNYGKPRMTHLQDEALQFSKLAATPESEALIGIFHGMNAVKKHEFGKPSKPVKKIAVLGAGLMGAGIAEVSVVQGKYEVLLKDKNVEGVSRGEKTIVDGLKDKLKKKRITNHDFCDTTSRLIPLHDDVQSWKKHFASADLVIEAVFEVGLFYHKQTI
jgi:enoyl-CoA hydratase/long-chain 3-hydroxyacyl-CoA dehydrogenase